MKTFLKGMLLVAIAIPAAAIGLRSLGSTTTGLAPEGMRAELSRDIVQRWEPYVRETYGDKAAGWGTRMLETTRGVDIANLELAESATSFRQMNAALLSGASAMQANQQAKLALAPASLGSPGSDLVYTPLIPCRIVDSRIVGGPIAAGTARSFKSYSATDFVSQGGDASNCGIPQNVSAISVKITSVRPAIDGYFTAYPYDQARPLASSLNYTQGLITSDETHIRLCRPACPSEFSVFSYGASDVVIDVTGYFVEPQATALDCTVAQQTGNLDLLSGLQARSVSCPAGYTATGGGCGGPLGISVSNSKPARSFCRN